MKFIGEVIDFSGDNTQDDFTTQLVNNNYPLNGIEDTHFVINDLPNCSLLKRNSISTMSRSFALTL